MTPQYKVGDTLQLNHQCTNRGQKVEVKEVHANGSTYVVCYLPHGIQLLTYYANELEPVSAELNATWLTLNADHEVIHFDIANEGTALDYAKGNEEVAFIARVTHVVKRRVDIAPTTAP